MIVAVDGPSGAGKSTLCKALASHFGYVYVDTGAMYRAIGLYVLEHNIDANDVNEIEKNLPNIQIDLRYQNGAQHIYLQGKDVSDDIRKPEVSMAASNVSKHPVVRAFLLSLQRSLAEKGNVLMDGRDIGTVVLPNADVKIFLTADQIDRAQRRFEELVLKGEPVTYEEVLRDIEKRDAQDMNREAAPLKPAPDAIVINTTGNTFDESLQELINLIEERQ